MRLLGVTTVTVTRPGVTTVTEGKPVVATGTTFSIELSIQPLTGREAQYLPEGIRERAQYKAYADLAQATLQPLDLSTGRGGDTLSYASKNWKVTQGFPWDLHVPAGHHKYILIMVTDR